MADTPYRRSRNPYKAGGKSTREDDSFERNKTYDGYGYGYDTKLDEFKRLEAMSKKLHGAFDQLRETMSKSNYDKMFRDIKKNFVEAGLITKAQAKKLKEDDIGPILQKLERRFDAIQKTAKDFEQAIKDDVELMVESAKQRGEAIDIDEQTEKSRRFIVAKQMKISEEEILQTERVVQGSRKTIIQMAGLNSKLKDFGNGVSFVTRAYSKQLMEMATFSTTLGLLKKAITLGWEQANELNRRGLLGAMVTIHEVNDAFRGLNVPIDQLADAIERNRAFVNQMGGGNKGLEDFLKVVTTTKQQLWFLGKDAGVAAIRFQDMAREIGVAKITDANGNVDPERVKKFSEHMEDVTLDFRKFRGAFNMTADQFADMNEQMMGMEEIQNRLHGLNQDQIFAIQKEQIERAKNLKYMGLSTEQVIKFNKSLANIYDPKKVNIVDMNRDAANMTQAFHRMIQDIRSSETAQKNPELLALADNLEKKHSGKMTEYQQLIASGVSQEDRMKWEDENKDFFRDYAATHSAMLSKLKDQEKMTTIRYAENNALHDAAMEKGKPLAEAKAKGLDQADPTTEEGRTKITKMEEANLKSEGTTEEKLKGPATTAAKLLYNLGDAVTFVTNLMQNPLVFATGALTVAFLALAKSTWAIHKMTKRTEDLLDGFDPDGAEDRKKKKRRGRKGRGKGPGMPGGSPTGGPQPGGGQPGKAGAPIPPGAPSNSPINPAPGAPEGKSGEKKTDSPDRDKAEKMKEENKTTREKLAEDRERIKADRGRVRMLGLLGKGLGLLSLGVAAWDAHEVYEDYKDDKITDSELAQQMGEEVASAVAGGIGSMGGSALGALIGMPLGPIGMAVGGAIGGMAGGYLGSQSENAKKDGRSVGKKAGELAGATGQTYSQKQMMNKEVGAVSEKYESSGRGVGTISSGNGDNGGVSYGKHQLATNNGSMARFLSSQEAAPFASQFQGLRPGTQEFNAKYKQLTNDEKTAKAMEDAQRSYIERTHVQPQTTKLQKELGLDVSKRGRAVQEAVWSTSVQYGGDTDVIKNALRGKDTSKMTDTDIVSILQDYKAANVDSHFRSSRADVRDSVRKRIPNEKRDLIAMAQMQEKEKAKIPPLATPPIAALNKPDQIIPVASETLDKKVSTSLTPPTVQPTQSIVKVPNQFDWSKPAQNKITPIDGTKVSEAASQAVGATPPQAATPAATTQIAAKGDELTELKTQSELLGELVRLTRNSNRPQAPSIMDRASQANGLG